MTFTASFFAKLADGQLHYDYNIFIEFYPNRRRNMEN